jgi:hypothetical protein
MTAGVQMETAGLKERIAGIPWMTAYSSKARTMRAVKYVAEKNRK